MQEERERNEKKRQREREKTRKEEKEGIDSGQVKVNDTTCCNVRVKDTRRRRRKKRRGMKRRKKKKQNDTKERINFRRQETLKIGHFENWKNSRKRKRISKKKREKQFREREKRKRKKKVIKYSVTSWWSRKCLSFHSFFFSSL